MKARDVLHLPSIWARLLKGAPQALKPISDRAREHYRRRWRWMDLLVAFDVGDEAANLLHPRTERRK